MDPLEKQIIIQKLANATTTAARCGGHYRAARNEENAQEYQSILLDAGEEIPTEEELYKIGRFNGDGAWGVGDKK